MGYEKLIVHLTAAALAAGAASAGAQSEVTQLPEVQVSAPVEILTGVADSAGEGTFLGRRFESRPLLRPGEMAEVIPGMIATQHSGGGKGNQYFIRGFNLDHGTDFRFTLDGMQINFTTHGHGQGYADLNFIIPELVERIAYRKGPYAAQDGDFATAGAADFQLYRSLATGLAQAGIGEDGYYRAVLTGSSPVSEGGPTLLYGVEYSHYDGPWVNPDDYRRVNGLLRLSDGTRQNGWALTAMAYSGEWNASDQIPRRAVDDGRLCRFCTVDPSSGGETSRYSLSGDWARSGESGLTRVNAYALYYDFDLFSNFTYFLSDPVNGDQFEQRDKRRVYGGSASHLMPGSLGGREMENELGVQLLYNDIDEVGLFNTAARQRLATVRADDVKITQYGLYGENRVRWTPWLRTVAGLRYDGIDADVESDNPANSGSANDAVWSPKVSAIFGPWSRTEFYANYGYGFHSNDVRGGTITIDPATGLPADRVPLLVKADGFDLGVRTTALPGVQSALTFFRLDLDSELVYIGDAGTTEPSFPSRRTGVEWATTWTPLPWLLLVADLTYADSKFVSNPAGERIPGAIERTAYLGAFVDGWGRWFGGAQLRYFGPRPLTEDGSVESSSTTLVNARIGYRFSKQFSAWLDCFNVFDREASDIEYFYESRLPGEPPGGFEDIHFHPAEPRTFRFTVQLSF
jgi:outer membrane receptor protein involved in Fe transport